MNTRLRAISTTGFASAVFAFFVLLRANTGQGREALPLWSGLVITFIVAVGTLWVLYFKRKGLSFITIGLYPAVALAPYIFLSETIADTILGNLERIPATVAATAGFALLTYLLVLTANVLNGAVLYKIPLGQAGKASQFVFSLISLYLLTTYLFNLDVSIVWRTLIIGVFVFYFTYSAIWCLQTISPKQNMNSAMAITLVISLLSALMTLWPLTSVYSTVIIVVVYYMLLNVAIEVREKIRSALWIEYAFLGCLIFIILATIAEWGINGSLL